jgi:hypothetical protein
MHRATHDQPSVDRESLVRMARSWTPRVAVGGPLDVGRWAPRQTNPQGRPKLSDLLSFSKQLVSCFSTLQQVGPTFISRSVV